MIRPLDELVEFIAGGASTDDVANFEASPDARAFVADLLRKEKTVGLTPDESSELDSYMKLEHVMRLAKARARILSNVK